MTHQIRSASLSLVLAALSLAAPACDEAGVTEENDLIATADGSADAAQETDAPSVGCTTNADCPGGWCVAPSHGDGPYPDPCTEVWQCVSEVPCSAAPPTLRCGCDGLADWFSAGCPEAPSVGALEASDLERAVGDTCDRDDLDGFRHDLVVTGTGFAELRAGGRVTIRWTRPDGTAGSYGGPSIDEDGAFEARDYDGFDPDPAGVWILDVLADTDSDGACDPLVGDAAWRFELSPPAAGDLELTLDRADPSDPSVCETWQP